MNKLIFTVGLLLAFVNSVLAQGDINYYEFYPTSALQLGKGFVKDDFTKTFKDALVTDGNDTSTNSAISSYLGMSVIYDAQTLKDKFHLDTKMEARYLTFKASASFNLDFSSVFQSNSLVILLEANSEFGQVRLKNSRIDPTSEAGILLKQGTTGYELFKTNYGTHFVNAIRRGISVYVLITISNISRDLQNKMGSQITGEFNLAAASGSLKVEISKEVQNASEQKRLDFKVFAKGGKGIGALDGIIKSLSFDTNTLEKIMSEIGKYVSNLDYQSAAPIGYFTTPYSQYGLDFRDIWTDERERIVQEITREYNRLYIINGNLDKLLDKDNYKYLLIDSLKIKEIEKYSKLVKQRLSELALLHKSSLTEADITKVKIPEKLVIDLSTLIPKLPNFEVIHDSYRLSPDFPIFRKLPLDFFVFSDANIPSQLKLIENIELLADGKLALDYRQILRTKKISISPIQLINEVYCGNHYSNELDKELKKFEDGIYKSISGEWGTKEVFYSVKLTDVFGRIFISNYYQGTYHKNSGGHLQASYFPLGISQFTFLPYQQNQIFIEIPVYSIPPNTDTLYLFKQPFTNDPSKQIDYSKYYNIKLPDLFAMFAGYSTKPFGMVAYSMADLKRYNTIKDIIPISVPFDGIKYYWSLTPNKLDYDDKTNSISKYQGVITVPLEKIIGETKIISISTQ